MTAQPQDAAHLYLCPKRRSGSNGPAGNDAADYCCFSQNDSRPGEAEPPITQGMPTSICPSAAAETQPSAIAPTPTCPQKSRLRRASEPLALSSSTAASASLRTAASCTVSAASITSASGALIAAGWEASSLRRNSRKV